MVLENFNIALTALQSNQLALNVISHNIANVNTPGYSRQRVEIATRFPQNHRPGQVGTGVSIESIERVFDEFTQLQLNVENRNMGEYTVERQILQQLENIFNEPSETGLQKALSEFFSAWQTLSNDPEDYSSRVVVVEKGRTLARVIKSLAEQLNALKNEIDESIKLKADEINQITEQIADLNDQIAKVEVGDVQNANDLRDKRDELVLKLNKILSVETHETQDNTILVETRGGVLVSGVYNIEVGTTTDENGHLVPVIEESNDRIFPQGGELKGYLDVRDNTIDDILDSLDDFAYSLIENVNRIHSQGTPLEQFTSVTSNSLESSGIALDLLDWNFAPKTGSFTISAYDSNGVFSEEHEISISHATDTLEDIRDRINNAFTSGAVQASINNNNQLVISSSGGYTFNFVSHSDESGDTSDFLMAMGINNFFEGHSALTIDVADNIANNPEYIAAGKSNSPGDNRNAINIASLQNEDVMDDDSSTFDEYFRAIVSEIGTLTQESLNNEDMEESIIALLKERRAQSTGVSIDEEAANLIRFQRAYQAAAKIVSVADSLFETLLKI